MTYASSCTNVPSTCSKGTKAKEPSHSKKSALRWTSGQMLQLVVSSVELMGQLMTDVARQHPVWLSWVAHVEYFLMLMQTSYTQDSIKKLRECIHKAHKLFVAVPEFKRLWVTKHHFSLHFPDDILRFGPPRFYWCMRFESKNQEHKRAAKTGNFKDVPGNRNTPIKLHKPLTDVKYALCRNNS